MQSRAYFQGFEGAHRAHPASKFRPAAPALSRSGTYENRARMIFVSWDDTSGKRVHRASLPFEERLLSNFLFHHSNHDCTVLFLIFLFGCEAQLKKK